VVAIVMVAGVLAWRGCRIAGRAHERGKPQCLVDDWDRHSTLDARKTFLD
jgi:hypothetical protein